MKEEKKETYVLRSWPYETHRYNQNKEKFDYIRFKFFIIQLY